MVTLTYSLMEHSPVFHVPGFSQCLILMAHIKAYDMYVPFFYCLLQSKKLDLYKLVLSQCVSQTDWSINPKTINCGNEFSLMQALTQEFPEAHISGCLFHFKPYQINPTKLII